MDVSVSSTLEKFYVFRSLHRNESWGALIIGSSLLEKLPNIDFGMKVFALNEKEAISKAKITYDRIHAYDSDKENVRRFAASALKHFIEAKETPNVAATKAMEFAVALLNKYNSYFNKMEKNEDE